MNEENETPSDAGNDPDQVLPPIDPGASSATSGPQADKSKWDGSYNDVNSSGAARPFVILRNGEKAPLTWELIKKVSNYDERTQQPNDSHVEEHVRIERFTQSLIQWEAGATSF